MLIVIAVRTRNPTVLGLFNNTSQVSKFNVDWLDNWVNENFKNVNNEMVVTYYKLLTQNLSLKN